MDDRRARNRTVRWLALGVFLTYLVSSSGGFESSDPVLRYLTARSWLAGQGGTLPRELGWNGGAVLPDGRIYCFYGPLQSLLMVPFILAARALPMHGLDLSVVETFLISLGLFPLLSTLAIILLYLALDLLGHPPRTALLATLGVAVGSLFWHYARMGQEENLLGLAFAVWLYGAARLDAGRGQPATWMGAGAATALATRWASLPLLAVLFALTLLLLGRFRARLAAADLALGSLLPAAAALGLLLYNYARFGRFLETGYGTWYAHQHQTMFLWSGYANHLAALLASPYRGLLFYSPIVVAAVAGASALRPGPPRLLAWGGLATLAAALLFFSSFRYWSAGHSWGPRFLASSQVLLAPALAGFFARAPRRALLVPALAILQLFSTLLPASTEEYVWYLLDHPRPGACTPWRFECTAVPGRIPRALFAVANTVSVRPGVALSGRPIVAPELVLDTSDYRTLYWWPVRIAFRLHRIPVWGALLVCALGAATALACLLLAWRSSADPPAGEA